MKVPLVALVKNTTRKAIWLLATSAALFLLPSCRAFKPSANMQHFDSYFAVNDTAWQNGKVRITFFGTSTLLFDDGETQLLIDGFFSRPKAAKVIFGRVKSNGELIQHTIQNHHINRLKGIFVCHSHYDHAMDAPYVAQLTGATVYGSSSTANVCKGAALPDSLIHIFSPQQTYAFDKFTVEVLPSKHTPPFTILGKSNATDPHHPNITEPLKQPAKAGKYIEGGTYDFYITHGSQRFLVKASTNYLDSALQQKPTDVLFLGTAMLGMFTNDFQEKYFAETVVATAAKVVVPIHWDNFTKPLKQPLQALPNIGDNVDAGLRFLIKKCEQQKVKVQLLQGEQSLVY